MRPRMPILLLGMLLVAAPPARADHVPPNAGSPTGLPADAPVLRVGTWRFLRNFPAGPGPLLPLGVDWQPFEREGRRYVAASSMTMGLTIFDVTDPLNPTRVSDYASSFGCPQGDLRYVSDAAARGQSPFGIAFNAALGAISGWENDMTVAPDGRWAVIGTDAPGRCHDPVGGGMEIVDLSDVRRPRLLHLVRTPGMSHSVTIDPAHPWTVWSSTSDSQNYIDVVDVRACLQAGVANRASCRPAVVRVLFPPEWKVGEGCHDIRFRGPRAYCAAIDTTLILDIASTYRADGGLEGTDLVAAGHCPVVDADPVTAPGVKVTDCSLFLPDAFARAGARGAPVRLVSLLRHDGRKPPDQDVEIAHQAEAIADGRIMIVTDERGGGLGVGPSDACPGGGIWFYNITDEANPRLMRQPDGKPAVFLTKNIVQTYANCTVHYGSQFADENLLVFAWYTQGTHLIRFTPDFATNTVAFEEVGTYVPAGGSAWTSMGLARNPRDPDELVVFVTDIVRGFDVLAARVAPVRLPRVEVKGVTVAAARTPRTLPATGAHPLAGGLGLVALAGLLGAFGRRRPRRA